MPTWFAFEELDAALFDGSGWPGDAVMLRLFGAVAMAFRPRSVTPREGNAEPLRDASRYAGRRMNSSTVLTGERVERQAWLRV